MHRPRLAVLLVVTALASLPVAVGIVAPSPSPTQTATPANATFDVSIEYGGNIAPPQSPAEAPESYAVNVTGTDADTLTVTSADLNRTLLAAMFGGETTPDGVRVPVPENGTLTMTLTAYFDCHPGIYDLQFRTGDGQIDTAQLSLTEPADLPVEFRGGPSFIAAPGEVVTIPLRLDACADDPVSITVADEDGDRRWNATVVRSGPGEPATLWFATNETTRRFVAVDGNATLRSQSTADAPGDPLPTGQYDTSLSQGGSTLVFGTIAIRSASDRETTTTASTPTEARSPTPTETSTRTPSPTPTGSTTTGISTVTTGESTERTTHFDRETTTEVPSTATEPVDATTSATPARKASARETTTAATGDARWLVALVLVSTLVVVRQHTR